MELRTLGSVCLSGHTFGRPKPLLLLAYLSMEGPQQRRQVSDLFWPEATDPRDSLSTTIRRLNRVDGGLIAAQGQVIATSLTCDAKELLALLDGGHYRTACERYAGPFLQGLDLQLSTELENWLYDTRDYIARRVRVALLALTEAAQLDGDLRAAVRHAEAAVKLSEQTPMEAHELRAVHRVLSAGDSP